MLPYLKLFMNEHEIHTKVVLVIEIVILRFFILYVMNSKVIKTITIYTFNIYLKLYVLRLMNVVDCFITWMKLYIQVSHLFLHFCKPENPFHNLCIQVDLICLSNYCIS
jgi:hypothetical protein